MSGGARLLPIACLLLLPRAAEARTQVIKTQAGSVVHWSQASIRVGIDRAAPSQHLHPEEVGRALELAAAAWNRVPADQPRFLVTHDSAPDVVLRFCRGAWQGDTIDLGRTRFAASPRDGSISTATIDLNECDHRLSPPGEEAADRFDLQSVITHELGHVLGLAHADRSGAVMFPSGSGTGSRAPSPDDETALATIYLGRNPPATDLATPATSGPSAPAAPATAAPSGLAQPSPPVAPGDAARVAPRDSVSVLSVGTPGDRELVIYTCEPTLLPAIVEAPRAEDTRRVRKPARPR